MARINDDSDSKVSSDPSNWRKTLDSDSFEYTVRDLWDKYSRKVKIGAVVAGIGVGIISSVYTVPNDSVGIVQTFGKYTTTKKPGLKFLIPIVQTVTKVQNQTIFSEAFGFRDLKPGVKSEYVGVDNVNKVDEDKLKEIIEGEGLEPSDDNLAQQAANILQGEYLMLNGDLSMADVEWIVQYKIVDPVAYQFNIKDAKKTLRDVSEATMRMVTGDGSIDEVLTTGRKNIEVSAKSKLQEKLDFYQTGLEVVLVQLQSSNAPARVKASFNAVNSAMQTKQQKINEAQKEYNTVIPEAEGKALAMIQEAEGYKANRINTAIGDVARFDQVLQQYKNAPQVTKTRMYLEAMPTLLDKAKDIYYMESSDGGLLLKKIDLNGGR